MLEGDPELSVWTQEGTFHEPRMDYWGLTMTDLGMVDDKCQSVKGEDDLDHGQEETLLQVAGHNDHARDEIEDQNHYVAGLKDGRGSTCGHQSQT